MTLWRQPKAVPRGIDFMPLLIVVVVAFALLGSLQFLLTLPGAEHGLLLFERACPIHAK